MFSVHFFEILPICDIYVLMKLYSKEKDSIHIKQGKKHI